MELVLAGDIDSLLHQKHPEEFKRGIIMDLKAHPQRPQQPHFSFPGCCALAKNQEAVHQATKPQAVMNGTCLFGLEGEQPQPRAVPAGLAAFMGAGNQPLQTASNHR